MGKIINLTGKKFGRLLVIGQNGRSKGGEVLWYCKCDCGNNKLTRSKCLMRKETQSCGCFCKEQTSKANRKHGFTRTNFYGIYRTMLSRCCNPKFKDFHNYGGRGIKCTWDSFEGFKNDMYKSYLYQLAKHGNKNTTIDRINVNGNYEKSNCRWISKKQQARNTRANHLITFNGKTACITEWAEKFNINSKVLFYRIYAHWPIEKALTTPVRK